MIKNILPLSAAILLTTASCSSEEDKAWESAVKTNKISAIDSFITKYPESKYKDDAQQIKEKIDWKKALNVQTVYAFKKYKADYPQSLFIDSIATKIQQITPSEIDLATMTQNSFVGKIDYGNRETQIINFKFSQIEKDSAGIRFTAQINTSDIRKTINGIINEETNDIIFQENPTDKVMLNISDGRVYAKGNKIILESININQYWKLVKYNN